MVLHCTLYCVLLLNLLAPASGEFSVQLLDMPPTLYLQVACSAVLFRNVVPSGDIPCGPTSSTASTSSQSGQVCSHSSLALYLLLVVHSPLSHPFFPYLACLAGIQSDLNTPVTLEIWTGWDPEPLELAIALHPAPPFPTRASVVMTVNFEGHLRLRAVLKGQSTQRGHVSSQPFNF